MISIAMENLNARSLYYAERNHINTHANYAENKCLNQSQHTVDKYMRACVSVCVWYA